MNGSLSDRLYRKISDLILLKNRQLRGFTHFLLLDLEFLRYADTVGKSECFLEDILNHPEGISGGKLFLVSLKRKVDHLCRSQDFCLRKIDALRRILLTNKAADFNKIFWQRHSRTKLALERSFQEFLCEAEDLIQQLPEIYQVAKFQSLLRQTSFLYLIIAKNHENFQYLVLPASVKSYSTYNAAYLKLHVKYLLRNLLLRYLYLTEDMDSAHSSSLESLREKLNMEIKKSRTEIVIQETELAELRQELFPSEISLKQQRDAAIDQLEIKELDLEHKIRSIDVLQANIQGLEYQVAKLIEERQNVHDQLVAKRGALWAGIRDVVRLEKLIQQIEREMSDRLFEFQEKLETLEKKRLAILADDTLTEEERARLLLELDQEIDVIREKHDADQQLLKSRCEELKEMSKSVTEDLDAFKEELIQKHLDEIRELEEMKKNATPSELELINAKIAALKQEFDENFEMLERAQARPKFFEDEFGRYYLNEAGQKVYQRDSGGSEYILTEDGQWVKVKDAVEIFTDEKGEFYFDSFGKKIYTKKYFEDELGKYYIDSKGRRVYLEQSSFAETESEENARSGEVVLESLTVLSEEPSETLTPAVSEIEVSEKIREQRACDVKYVQETVGFPLRKGLALAFLHQPEDPIEFIAKFLEKCHKDQKAEQERTHLLERVQRMKEEMSAEIKEGATDDAY